MSETIATIDIGTNSVLLLIVEQRQGELRALEQRCEITRLGAEVDRRGRLGAQAIARTLAALSDYRALVDRRGTTRVAAVATAVLREVDNGAAFVEPARRILGCPVEIVSGRQEAELVAAGVLEGLALGGQRLLIFDVGGGSTELIAVEGGAVIDLVSLDLGAVRLTERHLRRDPPGSEELAALHDAAAAGLAGLPPAFDGRFAELIGVAGTVTTLATVELALAEYDSERVNGLRLEQRALERQLGRYAAFDLASRRQIVGLDPKRADVILAGSVVVGAILERFDGRWLRVCDRGVRWGLARRLARAGRG
jgi:exopolyphosphatase/guanosine-5'-triphosphate,3'-diphosphate pyrophosphatase